MEYAVFSRDNRYNKLYLDETWSVYIILQNSTNCSLFFSVAPIFSDGFYTENYS